MGIFNEFFKKEKPIFTGSRFGFGSGAGGGSSAPVPFQITGADITSETIVGDHTVYKFSSSGSFEVEGGPGHINFFFVGGGGKGSSGRAGGGGGGGMRWVVNDPADPNFANTPTTPNYVDVSDGSYTVTVGRGGGKPGVSTPNSGETSFTSIDPTVSAGGGGNLNNSGNGYGAGGGGGNGDGGGQNNYGAGGPNGGAGGGKGTEGQGGGGGSGGDNSSPIGGGNKGRRITPANPSGNMENVTGGGAIRISPKIPWITNSEGANDGYFSGGGSGSADRSTNSSYHNASFTGGQGFYPPSTSGTPGADGSGGGGGGANPGGDGVVYLAIYNG